MEKPNQVLSQVKLAPGQVDEQVGILLSNDAGEMATIARPSMPNSQNVERLPTTRAISNSTSILVSKAAITYTEDGSQEVIEAGETAKALSYEVADMEKLSQASKMMHLGYTLTRCHGHYDPTP